ncbi:MAG: LD-carboxypeptidase [Hyphomonadaceae bacterium]|nr:LD-carboxypeptidase [Hyphomonadaceae bacterium]
MATRPCTIAVVAPAARVTPALMDEVAALARETFPGSPPVLRVDPQCYLAHGHFAGDDATRAAAFLQAANDPSVDAVWVARGGYGAGRLIEAILPNLGPAARTKDYLGYSDAGALLGALYAAGCGRVAHGPMPADMTRPGGAVAVARALRWLVARDAGTLEAGLADGAPAAAFNLTILATLIGTPWQPDLSGHVLMLEEVSEHMYRIDRTLAHVTRNPGVRRVAGIRLGRCSLIPPNDPDFGQTEEDVARHWCARSGIPYLGRADIGHDVDNKVAPFGAYGAGRD